MMKQIYLWWNSVCFHIGSDYWAIRCIAFPKASQISLDELLGKEKKITVLNEKPSKKDINKMVFRIQVLDAEDGDTININLPLALIRVCVNKEDGKINLLDGNKNLEGIDFNQLVELVEQGVVGELITVDSKNGDKVRIFVE